MATQTQVQPLAPALLGLPDGAQPEKWGGDVESMPLPDGVSSTVWEALCGRMMTDIHRNHMMTTEEKEAHLHTLLLPIPGDPPGRVISVVEDPTGVYAVGATGSVLWPAAVSMIELLDQVVPTDSKDLRVVELGAGLGCIGTFLHTHKGCYVALTDVSESLPLLNRNVMENFPDGEGGPEVLAFRWGDALQTQVLTVCGHYDLVVGSDITYRPEHIHELLQSACELLKPGGRLHLSLQDRPGEKESLLQAVEHSRMRIVSYAEAPMAGQTVAEKGTSLYEGSVRWNGVGAPDSVTHIYLFELVVRDQNAPKLDVCLADVSGLPQEVSPFPGLPLDAEDVEAEFFRMTGIQPDAALRPNYKEVASAAAPALIVAKEDGFDLSLFMPPSRSSPTGATPSIDFRGSKNGTQLSSKSRDLKKSILKDYLDRGLAGLLCDMDEEVRDAVAAMKKDDRPRSDKQKRKFAEDFYARKAEAEAAALAIKNEPKSLADADTASGADSVSSETAALSPTAESPPAEVESAAEVCSKAPEERSIVRSCMPGLEWDVSINEEDRQLSATVSFKEEVWEALQGSDRFSGSVKSFREAVSFELSEQELRVTYMDSAVLELGLPRPVQPSAAAAKLSSKQRRVTVNVPLS